MKFAINRTYGGFCLSTKAEEMLPNGYVDRDDPDLIEVIETLGDEASGKYGKIRVAEIPDEATDWRIDEYDGLETLLYVIDGKIIEWDED